MDYLLFYYSGENREDRYGAEVCILYGGFSFGNRPNDCNFPLRGYIMGSKREINEVGESRSVEGGSKP